MVQHVRMICLTASNELPIKACDRFEYINYYRLFGNSKIKYMQYNYFQPYLKNTSAISYQYKHIM